MAPSQRVTGTKPGPGQGKPKIRPSKRTVSLAKQQNQDLLKRISQLEFQESFSDEKAEHNATKAIASRLRLEHNDLVTRLDEAETAVANAESRAWKSEKEIIKLQESLSKSRLGAQNNEAWMELMAEENQQLEEANARIVARNIMREGELIQEIEHMEERAQQLEQSLTIAYRDVEEYRVLFQRNAEDWAELVNFLDKHQSEEGDRIQKLRRLVMEYSNAMEGVHEEVNKLIQAAEVRIARNRLRRYNALSRAGPGSLQWDSQTSRSVSHASSDETISGSVHLLGSSESDSDSLPSSGEIDTDGLMSSTGTYIEPTKDELQSLDALAPLVDKDQCGFAVFDVNGTCRGSESTLGGDFNSDSDIEYDRDQDRTFASFLHHWEGGSSISQGSGQHPYNGQGREKSWDQITDGSSSPEGADGDKYMGQSWSNPSLPDSRSLSNSQLLNLSFESWKFLKEPSRLVQKQTEIARSSMKAFPLYFGHFPGGYTPPLNTSRKRVRFAPPSPNPNCDVDDEASVNSEQDESIRGQELNVVPSSGPTDCKVPQSALDSWIVNNELDQASILSVDQQEGNLITRVSESKGIQTDDTPLLARPENLAASLKALVMAPKKPLDPGGKLRSLSVGDLPRVLAEGGSAFERMPGSWPHEAITYADINPDIASEIANAALRGFRVAMEYVLPVSMKLLNRLSPSHPRCIVYPALMALWVWQAWEQHVEGKRWERANERYMVQRLRNQYALQVGWVDSMGFSLAQWLAFDRSSFG